jgi:UDP-N-acetyl-D-glucosamine dehydrogenase
MPYYCRSLVSQALNHGAGKALSRAKVLVLGVSYKRDLGDMRESPALKIIELLRDAGADVAYHDPYVPELAGLGLSSVELDVSAHDCVAIVTDHSSVDYDAIVRSGAVVVDFRNATGPLGTASELVWKL